MKRIAGIILIFLCFTVKAQDTSKHPLFYVNGGLSMGNFSGGQAGINFAVENRFSLQLEYSGILRKAKEKPEDYSAGMLSIFVLFANGPVDKINSIRFMAGKIVTINPTGKTKLNLKAGFSYSTYSESYNFIKDPAEGLLLVPNYSWDSRRTGMMGVIIKSELEHTISRIVGYSISPYVEISSEISSVGVAFNLLLGRLGKRNPQAGRYALKGPNISAQGNALSL